MLQREFDSLVHADMRHAVMTHSYSDFRYHELKRRIELLERGESIVADPEYIREPEPEPESEPEPEITV